MKKIALSSKTWDKLDNLPNELKQTAVENIQNSLPYLLEHAKKTDDAEYIGEMLKQKWLDFNTVDILIADTVKENKPNILTFFIAKKDSLKITFNPSLLHMAARAGHKNIASLFILNKLIDIDASEEGNSLSTPLHSAIKEGQLEIVKFLIDQKAKLDQEDAFGQTPIQLADAYKNHKTESCLKHGHKHREVFEYLLNYINRNL